MVKPDNSFNTFEETCLNSPTVELNVIAYYCQHSPVGKLLPDAFYIHILALPALHPLLQEYERYTRKVVPQVKEATIVKFSTSKPKISYLFYPDFDTDAHPALHTSIQVDLETLEVNYRDYSSTDNPPILHRKETFVTPDYYLYKEFSELTSAQDALGLLDNSRGIGTKTGWEKRLQAYGVEISGHTLIKNSVAHPQVILTPKIERHKAAIIRHDFSRPIRLALDSCLFTPETSFFDYGCGHGGDLTRITELGYSSSGWDLIIHLIQQKYLRILSTLVL